MQRKILVFSILFLALNLFCTPRLEASNDPEIRAVVTTQAGGGHSVALSWTPSATPGVAYNVYSGTATGQETTKLTAAPVDSACSSSATCIFTDTSISTAVPGAKFFYIVKAVQPDGTESAPSNEVSAQIPFPVPAAPANLAVTGKT